MLAARDPEAKVQALVECSRWVQAQAHDQMPRDPQAWVQMAQTVPLAQDTLAWLRQLSRSYILLW